MVIYPLITLVLDAFTVHTISEASDINDAMGTSLRKGDFTFAHWPMLLFDKEVFVECGEWIDERPVGFWHMISLEDKHKFSKLVPCVNDPNLDLCGQNCISGKQQVPIKYNTETRNLCLYRACRLPWVIDIIKLANRDDPSVDIWLKPGGKNSCDKLYLRYNHEGNDYVVIFSAEKRFYRIISAYPVFYLSEKYAFKEDHKAYRWSYFNK